MISQVQTNSGIFSSVMPGARMLRMVTTILMAPVIDEMPIKWTAKIRKGNASPVCSTSGGYMVQPPAGAPPGRNNVDSSSVKAAGNSQKPQLLMRGRARSEQPTCIGTIQLARPTKPGMTPPKIITSACIVVIWLKNSGCTNCRPGWNSSARMTSDIIPPMKNMVNAKNRYSVPRSLWLVVLIQRMIPLSGPWWS